MMFSCKLSSRTDEYNFCLSSFTSCGECLCSKRRRITLSFFVMQVAKHLCLRKSEHRQLVFPLPYDIFLLYTYP